MDGESLQNSAEALSRPSHSQRSSTSGLLLVSMATSLMLLTALEKLLTALEKSPTALSSSTTELSLLTAGLSSFRLNLPLFREDSGLLVFVRLQGT